MTEILFIARKHLTTSVVWRYAMGDASRPPTVRVTTVRVSPKILPPPFLSSFLCLIPFAGLFPYPSTLAKS